MNKVTNLKKLSSHFLQYVMSKRHVLKRRVLSKGQIRFTDLTDNKSSWQNICNLIYSVSIDNYTRYFQYKTLHNFISVNSKLKKWNIIDSNRCSYCFIESETVEHLFTQCPFTVTLYNQIKQWCKNYDINLP